MKQRRPNVERDPLSADSAEVARLAQLDPGRIARELVECCDALRARALALAEQNRARRSEISRRPMTEEERDGCEVFGRIVDPEP
jgi:hypothetical protein